MLSSKSVFTRIAAVAARQVVPLQLFPMRVDCRQFLLFALVFVASASAFFVQLAAHGCFFLIGAVYPPVDPSCPGFHARNIRPESNKRSTDVHRAGRKVSRRRLLCFIK